MGYKRSARMQQRLVQNHRAILQSARLLIAKGGIKEAQIQAIAEMAGVSSGLVYRYFDNKNHIIIEVLSEAVQGELVVLKTIANQSLPPDQKLYKAIATFVRRALNSPQLAYSLMLEPADAAVEAARFENKQLVKEIIQDILTDGKNQAVFEFDDVATTALCMVGAITFAVIEPLSINPKSINRQTFANQVAQFCLNSVYEPKPFDALIQS